jgi:hypothetical protein
MSEFLSLEAKVQAIGAKVGATTQNSILSENDA